VARIHDVVFDAHHPASLARFWARALDGYAVAPYDEAEVERLRAMGIDDLEDDPGVIVEAPAGPRLYFQQVPEAKTAKNRVHLDLACDDVEAEVARLVGLGARLLADRRTPDGGWIAMADPEGNEFCISK